MPAVPTAPDLSNGVFPIAQLNAGVIATVRYLLKPPLTELRQTSAQSLTTSVSTAITFNTETADTDIDGVGGHDNATDNTRYTARYPGWYQVSGGAGFANNGTGVRLTFWSVNGTGVNGSQVEVLSAGAGVVSVVPARTVHVFLNVGDYVELFVLQNSGGALNTAVAGMDQPNASIRWVSS